MSWNQDHLAPDERLLYRNQAVKIGCFQSTPQQASFECTPALDNDVLVLPRNPLWWRRDSGAYRFIEPGGILVHRAGAQLERRCVVPEGDRAYWFGIRPALFDKILQRHGLCTDDLERGLLADALLRHELECLLQSLRDPGLHDDLPDRVLTLFEKVCRLMRAAAGEPEAVARQQTRSRHALMADKARAHIHSHLAQAINLATIARAVASSPFHLNRVFRKETGLTPVAYRDRLRIGIAMKRLISDDTSLTDLALELGYSSASHFNRVFRREAGQPPSRFRRTH